MPALVPEIEATEPGRYRHPQWWIDAVRSAYPDRWESALRNSNLHPPLILRVNRRRLSVTAYLEKLASSGMEARLLGQDAVLLEKPCRVERLPGFAAGEVSVQDLGAQRAALLLDACDGMRILDACAAPGGKATELAELIGDRGEILAVDQSPDRINTLQRNLKRLGLTSVKSRQFDLTRNIREIERRGFNKILLDAPCSGMGVLRRHPEGKWQKRENLLPSYAKLQFKLLEAVSKCLKGNGILVYSTCSTEPEENEKVIEKFLKAHPAFKIENPKPFLPEVCHRFIGKDHFLRTYPAGENMDGFFAVRMARKS